MFTEFLEWDDKALIVDNAVVNKGLNLGSMLEALETIILNLWSPLSLWSHQLDVSLFGLNPDAHHCMSFLYHIIAGLALWWVLRNGLKIKRSNTLIIVGLFLVHPAQVESWAWVSERKDILAALFGFLSLGAWGVLLEKKSTTWKWITVICLLLSLMAKPTFVVWPVIALSMCYLKRNNINEGRRLICFPATFLCASVLCIAIVLVTLSVQGGRPEIPIINKLDLMSRLVLGFANYTQYCLRFFYPLDLSYFYPLPKSLPLAMSLLGLLFVGGMVCWAWIERKRRPMVSLGFLLFIVMLAPTCGFILSGESYGPDRYGYMAYIGLSMVIAHILPDRMWDRRLVSVACLIVLIGLSSMSYRQALVWRNMQTLTAHALENNSENYKAHAHRALWLQNKGKAKLAFAHWKETYRIRPDHESAAVVLGNQAVLEHEYKQAIELFTVHQKYWPGRVDSKSGLAAALAKSGNYVEALELYSELTKKYPDRKDFRNNFLAIQEVVNDR